MARGTFRENLVGSKELQSDHYGASFKWNDNATCEVKRKHENGDRGDSGMEDETST